MTECWREGLDWRATLRHDERMPTKHLTAPASTPGAPVDPARVSPLHLPAMHHVAADIYEPDVPIRIVTAGELDPCGDCDYDDLDTPGPVATVRATDAHGYRHSDDVCVLHLPGLVRHHSRQNRAVVIEIGATEGRRWFERSDRETYYALDESRGIAATRGIWDAWQVVEVVDGFGSPTLLASVGLRDGESFNQARARAEVLAQAVAAVRAADAYESGFVIAETVALPVVTVTEVAA